VWFPTGLFLLALLSGLQLSAQVLSSPPNDSPDGPDGAMMAPVTALARYMAHVDGAVLLLFLQTMDWLSSRTSRPTFLMAKMRQHIGTRVTGSLSHGLPN